MFSTIWRERGVVFQSGFCVWRDAAASASLELRRENCKPPPTLCRSSEKIRRRRLAKMLVIR